MKKEKNRAPASKGIKIVAFILGAVLLALVVFYAVTQDNPSGQQPSAGETITDVAESDYEYIIDKDELVIGITYFEPMNYFNDANELVGFETEFAKAVCEKLGVNAKFQEISWSAKETELAAKNIDCIWNGMTIDANRLANMSISIPYMANKQVLVVKAGTDVTTVDGLTVVAEKESAGEGVATGDSFFENANYIAVDTQSKALMEVAAGTADACVVDYVCSIGMIGEGTDYTDLVVADTQAFNDEQYGIAFRKGSDATAKVNEVIQALADDGTLNTIASEYKLAEQIIVNPAA